VVLEKVYKGTHSPFKNTPCSYFDFVGSFSWILAFFEPNHQMVAFLELWSRLWCFIVLFFLDFFKVIGFLKTKKEERRKNYKVE